METLFTSALVHFFVWFAIFCREKTLSFCSSRRGRNASFLLQGRSESSRYGNTEVIIVCNACAFAKLYVWNSLPKLL